MSGDARPGSAAPLSTGRAVLLYTTLRLLLFLLCWVVLLVLGMDGLLAAAAAVLVSSVIGLVALRPQRAALNEAVLARTERKRADSEALRRRLDDDPSAP